MISIATPYLLKRVRANSWTLTPCAGAGATGTAGGQQGNDQRGQDDAGKEQRRQPVAAVRAPRLIGVAEIEHHDDEHEEHHDGAGIDDHLEHRHQRRRQQIEDHRQGKEGGHQIDDGMHRMLLGDGKDGGDHRDSSQM